MILGLRALDAALLLLYLAGITGLGIWVGRGAKNTSEFFMPRRFGKIMMITNAFGTGTASDQAVLVASGTFRNGLSGIWYQWLWLFATPFYWVIAPLFRRFRAVTTADVYALRFDRSVAVLFAVVGIAGLSVKIGLLLKGTSALMDACTGGAVNANVAIVLTSVLFVTYGTFGGLSSAIVTDFVQGILTLVFSFMLLPVVLMEVGGLSGVKETIQDPAMLSLVAPGQIGLFFVIMMGVQALVGIVAQPFIMGVCATGKTEFEGRVGLMFGNFAKRLCTMAWSVTALAGVAWYMQRGVQLSAIDPDKLYGNIAQHFLPNLLPGALGLFLAAMLAAIMSSCDAFMLSSAALFTQNMYRPVVKRRSDWHYLLVGRVVGIVVVLGGIYFAFWVDSVVTALKIWLKIAPMMGIAFWLGLLWRRLNVAGAWAITLTGFGVWFISTKAWFVTWVAGMPGAEALGLIWEGKNGAAIHEPWQIAGYMCAAVFAGIVVSLLTRPVEDRRLQRFYDLTRTPIGPDEPPAHDCALPEGVAPAERKMLTTALGLELPVPSWTSTWGFALGWAGVAVIVGGFMLLWI